MSRDPLENQINTTHENKADFEAPEFTKESFFAAKTS